MLWEMRCLKMVRIKSKLMYVLLIVYIVVNTGLAAQIYTTVSKRNLYVGDRITLTVSIIAPSGATIVPPEVEEGIGPFAVKEWFHDRVDRDHSDSLSFRYHITTYETKLCTIPSLPFIETKGESYDTLFSDSLPMQVLSVIAAMKPDSGDTIRLKDLKEQQIAGKPSLLWLWLLIAAALITAGIFIGRHFFAKQKQVPQGPPPKPPYEEAMDSLRALENKNYLSQGLLREYVFELSEILKWYMERRYQINAAEFTTEEMLEWINGKPFAEKLCRSMEWFFDVTHPVKFAKIVPDMALVKKLTEETKHFLHTTRPNDVVPNKQQAQSEGAQQ